MNIEFNHKYKKLGIGNGQYCKKIKLLDVVNVNLENLSAEFLEYDTDAGLFKLSEKGKYLMLIFLKEDYHGSNKNLLITIRSWKLDKEKDYRSEIGKWFDVKINNKKVK
jgi:hypothetical protein